MSIKWEACWVVGLALMSPWAMGSAPDPMRPPAHLMLNATPQAVASSALQLQMILVSDHRKIAVINDKMMQEGDVKHGITLISIDDNQVSVKRKGKIIDLKLKSVNTKKGLAK